MTYVMHKFLMYFTIYFFLTCFGLSFSTSSEAGVQLREWFKSPGRVQTWLLHHDNVPSHTSVLTQQFLVKYKMALIPQPPYSPYLAPCDFFLFQKMKLNLKGRRFDSIEVIQAKLQRVLDTLTEKDFQEAS
jgi:hypothetical protein